MIDDDDQAYLFYGNNMLWYAKLSMTMTSLTSGDIEIKTKDELVFGPFKGTNATRTAQSHSFPSAKEA